MLPPRHRVREVPARHPTGRRQAADLPALNAEEIEALVDRTVAELLSLLEDSVEEAIGQIKAYGDKPPVFCFHGGCLISADVALGVLLGELSCTAGIWPAS